MSAQHTPTPWGMWCEEGYTKSGKALHSICANNLGPDASGQLKVSCHEEWHKCIGEIRGDDEDQARANAAFIVRACNSHEELVATLQAVMSEWREGYGLNCVDRVRAALALAEGSDV